MRYYLIIVLALFLSSCVRNKNGVIQQDATQTNNKIFEVAEVIQASSYTYLKVKENMDEHWVAVNKQDANPGDVYYYDDALEMSNFTSKDLNRTFDKIYFVNQISKTPIEQITTMGNGMGATYAGKVNVKKSDAIKLEKGENEITIGQIYSNKAKYADKEIEVRGIVVKANNDIMGQNWIHIQDGTTGDGNFDLTVTTTSRVNKGDEVTFKGKIILNKDYGAGYKYDVIMVDANPVEM
ncbi:MAG: hypothetical protein CSA36_00660 [Draconibacterium sp.]|nr:MAG: hypothetical protein CSA36_00660 [Draconibacterium sp.]